MKDNRKDENIYTNIKIFREFKNLTREKVASDLNMSLSGYAKIERGEVDMPISRLFEIAEVLHVEVIQILNFQLTHFFNFRDDTTQTHSENLKMPIHNDNYIERYIRLLEQEVERLKKVE